MVKKLGMASACRPAFLACLVGDSSVFQLCTFPNPLADRSGALGYYYLFQLLGAHWYIYLPGCSRYCHWLCGRGSIGTFHPLLAFYGNNRQGGDLSPVAIGSHNLLGTYIRAMVRPFRYYSDSGSGFGGAPFYHKHLEGLKSLILI
jgi:hypothetical protein